MQRSNLFAPVTTTHKTTTCQSRTVKVLSFGKAVLTHGIELALAVSLIEVRFCLNDRVCNEINSAIQWCN